MQHLLRRKLKRNGVFISLFCLVTFAFMFGWGLSTSDPIYILLMAIAFCFTILALVNVKAFLYSFILIYPLAGLANTEVFETAHRQALGLTGLLNLILIVVATTYILTKFAKNEKLHFTIFHKLLIIFVILATFSTLRAPQLFYSFRGLTRYLSFVAAIFLTSFLIRTQKDMKKLVNVILLSAVIPMSFGFYERIFVPADLQILKVGNFSMKRMDSVYGSPVFFGLYLSLFISPFILSFILHSQEVRERNKWMLAYLPVLAGIILSASRNAWITLSVSLVFLLFITRRYKSMVAVLLIGAIVFLSVPALNQPFLRLNYNRVLEGERASTLEGRMIIWTNTSPILKRAILLGIGPQYFSIYYEKLMNRYIGPHGTYVMLWAELGLGALLIYICIIFMVLKKSLSDYRKLKPSFNKTVALGFSTCLLCIFIAGMVDNVFHIDLFLLTGMVIGMLLSSKDKEAKITL